MPEKKYTKEGVKMHSPTYRIYHCNKEMFFFFEAKEFGDMLSMLESKMDADEWANIRIEMIDRVQLEKPSGELIEVNMK